MYLAGSQWHAACRVSAHAFRLVANNTATIELLIVRLQGFQARQLLLVTHR